MTTQESGVDAEQWRRVVDGMAQALTGLLKRTEPITAEMGLEEELGVSSLLALELLLEVEQLLEIMIDVEPLAEPDLRTVGDLAAFVVRNSRPE